MNQKRCALETLCVAWQFINWRKIIQQVKSLQQRIVKALKQGRHNKVKALQWLLVHSHAAKLLAVKRVTENKGKNTAGVDRILWDTPTKKLKAVKLLKRRGYKASPLKRVYILKKNGKKRPLGIPTMKDRAMQALYLMALDPVSEATADGCSYGFRPRRCCADAIARGFIHLSRQNSASWVLEGDIKGCFDHINHQWLIENIPVDKVMLKQWLKAGFIDNKRMFPTEEGTPQGGIISPVLANMTLDGLQNVIDKALNIKTDKGGFKRQNKHKVHLVRYADDFIVTADTPEILNDTVKPLIEKFLAERGLELSQEKTHITCIDTGFNFLGQNIRKYDGTLLIKPTKESLKSIAAKVKEVVNNNKASSPANLIFQLNPIIRGWCNYHRHVASGSTFPKLDNYMWLLLWNWALRRHQNKSRIWIRQNYFKTVRTNNWVFCGTDEKGKQVSLIKASHTKIIRHKLITSDANPYDEDWQEYFKKRSKSTGYKRPQKQVN
jgi:RNA-directed DNA polymerase